MPKESLTNFTSTGEKLLLWPDILLALQKLRMPTPINIQISPTNKCNLNCSFCSVGGRDKSLELDLADILNFIDELSMRKTVKAVEITGGGEPTLYPEIEKLISELVIRDLSVGLITNGLELTDRIAERYLKKLSWIRISMNTLEITGKIQIPRLICPTIMGFSYVSGIPTEKTKEFLQKVIDLSYEYLVSYIRLVPNCLEDVTTLRKPLQKLADSLDQKVFFQDKYPKRPNACYLVYVKPYLYSNGIIYPCNSVSLAPEANRDFPANTAIFHMSVAHEWMRQKFKGPCICSSKHNVCKSCRFFNQNKLLHNLLRQDTIHKEHI